MDDDKRPQSLLPRRRTLGMGRPLHSSQFVSTICPTHTPNAEHVLGRKKNLTPTTPSQNLDSTGRRTGARVSGLRIPRKIILENLVKEELSGSATKNTISTTTVKQQSHATEDKVETSTSTKPFSTVVVDTNETDVEKYDTVDPFEATTSESSDPRHNLDLDAILADLISIKKRKIASTTATCHDNPQQPRTTTSFYPEQPCKEEIKVRDTAAFPGVDAEEEYNISQSLSYTK